MHVSNFKIFFRKVSEISEKLKQNRNLKRAPYVKKTTKIANKRLEKTRKATEMNDKRPGDKTRLNLTCRLGGAYERSNLNKFKF